MFVLSIFKPFLSKKFHIYNLFCNFLDISIVFIVKGNLERGYL